MLEKTEHYKVAIDKLAVSQAPSLTSCFRKAKGQRAESSSQVVSVALLNKRSKLNTNSYQLRKDTHAVSGIVGKSGRGLCLDVWCV